MGLKSMVLAAIIAVIIIGIFAAASRFMGQSETRTSGGISGLFGQPAVVNYATGASSDSRILTGYTSTIVVAQFMKIVVIPVMLL
ncbi:hypothetical protein ACUY26_08645 [Corynebacterium segmentosum]